MIQGAHIRKVASVSSVNVFQDYINLDVRPELYLQSVDYITGCEKLLHEAFWGDATCFLVLPSLYEVPRQVRLLVHVDDLNRSTVLNAAFDVPFGHAEARKRTVEQKALLLLELKSL